MNAWNDNNTHRHQCWPRVSHLETSAFLTLCHSFPVTCQQMCKNLKMWLTDLLTDKRTDRRTDKRVAGGHYCWGVLLWPPQLGLGGKCDKKWKFKNVEKITSFSDAVTLTFDLQPWKVNQVRTLSLPMCIPNLRTIHPVDIIKYATLANITFYHGQHVSYLSGSFTWKRSYGADMIPSTVKDGQRDGWKDRQMMWNQYTNFDFIEQGNSLSHNTCALSQC